MNVTVPPPFPPAPSLEHLKKSANSIRLVEDCYFCFTDQAPLVPKGDLRSLGSKAIQVGEPLLQGPSDTDWSELVAAVSTCLQQVKADGQPFKLNLYEEGDEKDFSFYLKFDERFVWKVRSLLLAPFLTVEGFILYGAHSASAPYKKWPISHEIEFHLVSTHSPVLAAMISPENGMKEGQTGRVELKENSEEGVKQLLRYFYCTEVDTDEMDCDVALELFKTAHKYELPYLEVCKRDLLLRKGKEWFTSDVALEMYYHVRNVKDWAKLRDHSLRVMTRMPSEVRSCDRFKELSREEAEDLIWKLFDFKGTD